MFRLTGVHLACNVYCEFFPSGLKQQDCEAQYSHPYSARILRHRGNFTFSLNF